MKIQDFIQRRFSGELNNEAEYIELFVHVIGVLIVGLLLWRMMAMFHRRKNAKRKKSEFFDSSFSKKWKE